MEKIRKVPVEALLDLLTDLYNNGVDFVDITGTVTEDPIMDSITISVLEDYVNPEYIDSFMENFDEPQITKEDINIKIEKKLSDTDISDLLP